MGDSFSTYYNKLSSDHWYPTEWAVRTLLGNYPEDVLSKNKYQGQKVLDLGFGDGRNFPLLRNCGFDIFGVEVDKSICGITDTRIKEYGIQADLKVGRNDDIPFDSKLFDMVFSSFAFYYLSPKKSIEDNFAEVTRVLKNKGSLVATLADSNTFVFKNAEDLGDGYYKITYDPFNLRNGDILKAFDTEEEIFKSLKAFGFDEVSIGHTVSNYYGLRLSYFMVQAKLI